MKIVSGKCFAKILEKKGWKLCRIRGSHHVYYKEGLKERITIPIHGNSSLKMGLQIFLMKIADVKESEL